MVDTSAKCTSRRRARGVASVNRCRRSGMLVGLGLSRANIYKSQAELILQRQPDRSQRECIAQQRIAPMQVSARILILQWFRSQIQLHVVLRGFRAICRRKEKQILPYQGYGTFLNQHRPLSTLCNLLSNLAVIDGAFVNSSQMWYCTHQHLALTPRAAPGCPEEARGGRAGRLLLAQPCYQVSSTSCNA